MKNFIIVICLLSIMTTQLSCQSNIALSTDEVEMYNLLDDTESIEDNCKKIFFAGEKFIFNKMSEILSKKIDEYGLKLENYLNTKNYPTHYNTYCPSLRSYLSSIKYSSKYSDLSSKQILDSLIIDKLSATLPIYYEDIYFSSILSKYKIDTRIQMLNESQNDIQKYEIIAEKLLDLSSPQENIRIIGAVFNNPDIYNTRIYKLCYRKITNIKNSIPMLTETAEKLILIEEDKRKK